jgi:hypothetical protein
MRRISLKFVLPGAMILMAQFVCASSAMHAQPSPAALRAYDDYLRAAEARMAADYLPGGAFIANAASALNATGSASQPVLTRCVAGCDSSGVPVSGGLIHDWLGVVVIPGASLRKVLALVQNYDHSAAYYAPNVTESRLLAHSGDSFSVFLRLKQSEWVTVRFDTEYDIRYVRLDQSRMYSVSHSTRVVQLARGPQDRELPPAENDGYLWRLDSYWRFEQVSSGVFVQCRAISLSRDIPRGFGWIVAPFIRDIPRKSLDFTLSATRSAVLKDSPPVLPHNRTLRRDSKGE